MGQHTVDDELIRSPCATVSVKEVIWPTNQLTNASSIAAAAMAPRSRLGGTDTAHTHFGRLTLYEWTQGLHCVVRKATAEKRRGGAGEAKLVFASTITTCCAA
jgi:hypothetical protein